jgi:hypothetical protein
MKRVRLPVQHDEERAGEIDRQRAQDRDDGVDTARGTAEHDDIWSANHRFSS